MGGEDVGETLEVKVIVVAAPRIASYFLTLCVLFAWARDTRGSNDALPSFSKYCERFCSVASSTTAV